MIMQHDVIVFLDRTWTSMHLPAPVAVASPCAPSRPTSIPKASHGSAGRIEWL